MVNWNIILNPIGILWVPLKIPLGQFGLIKKKEAKLVYNCGSHAKGESQKFKIEEIKEL